MLMRSWDSVTVVRSAATRNAGRLRKTCNAMALSLPPLQQKRMGSGVVMARAAQRSSYFLQGRSCAAPLEEHCSVGLLLTLRLGFSSGAELIADAGHKIQAQRREAEHLFVFLVGKVVQDAVDFNPAGEPIRETRVRKHIAGIAEETGKP